MTAGTRPPWWRGAHGEWYVAAQVVLGLVVFFGPRTLPGLPAWPAPLAYASVLAGGLLMALGGALAFASLFKLGSNLTPLPYPKERATLVQSGPYALVRHPIYAGGILVAYGWALVVRGWLTLAYATALLLFFEIKASREEQWLVEKFPEYPAYRARVRKLIPFIH